MDPLAIDDAVLLPTTLVYTGIVYEVVVFLRCLVAPLESSYPVDDPGL